MNFQNLKTHRKLIFLWDCSSVCDGHRRNYTFCHGEDKRTTTLEACSSITRLDRDKWIFFLEQTNSFLLENEKILTISFLVLTQLSPKNSSIFSSYRRNITSETLKGLIAKIKFHKMSITSSKIEILIQFFHLF